MFVVSIGSFKFNVAGKILLLSDKIENIDSTLPAAPKRWPIDDLVELTKILCVNNLEIALSSISSPFFVEVPWAFIYSTLSEEIFAILNASLIALNPPSPSSDGAVI